MIDSAHTKGRTRVRLIVCLSLALAAASACAVEIVYRSIAPDGTVTYSDRPSEGATAVVLATSRPVEPPPSRIPAQPRPNAGSGVAGRPEAPPQQSAAERAEERARNCATARERAEQYAAAHRLYRTLENGEREYLNDGEIDEARARAAADVETWCD